MAADKKRTTIIDTILDLKKAEPFDPFRIVTASGDKYLIEDGDNLVLMDSQFFYAAPRSDRFVFIRLNQIVAVEQFERTHTA